MPTYASLQNRKAELVRKVVDWSVFTANYTATVPTAITDSTSAALPIALPTGFSDVGWTGKEEGGKWALDLDASDTMAYGSAAPIRRDINKKVTTLNFTMLETKKQTLELYHSVDLTGVVPQATSGEVTFDEPTVPPIIYKRVLAFGRDGAGADTIYIARLLPRASVTDVAELSFKDDEELKYNVTFTAYVDSVLGTAVRYYFGGPGWLALTGAKHGFA